MPGSRSPGASPSCKHARPRHRKDATWQSPPSTTSPLAPRDREWDGAAAEKRIRAWADAEDKPNGKYRDAHIWYDADSKQNFTAYKLLFTDIVNGRQVAVPRAIMAAGNIMQGSRGGIDLPESDITRSRTTSRSTTRKWARPPPGNGTE